MLRSMNRNYLLKDELQYELSARGISSESDVQTLRKLFRSILGERVPVDLRNLSTQSVEELYEYVVNKSLELQSLITQQKTELALLTPRFQTRIPHLRGSVLHLTDLNPSESGITTSKFQEVRDRLDSIEINLAKMDVADRPGQEMEEDDDASNSMQEEASPQDNSSPDERQDRQDTGRVSTFTGAVDVEVGTLADQIALVNAGMEAAQVTPSGQGIKQVFTPHLYQRLPHSLSHLLKELPVVDGTCLAAFRKIAKSDC